MNAVAEQDTATAAAIDGLLAILPRVDALNSYVRSESARRGSGHFLSAVIYHYKREALKTATQFRIATHRRVAAVTKCIDCGGKGRYTDCNGYTHDHCWKCHNTGSAKLLFIESTMPVTLTVLSPECITWHSPERDAYAFCRGYHEMPEESAGDWKPHQKGRDLTADELAKHLLEVEEFFPAKPMRHYSGGDYDYHESCPHLEYRLYVGCSRDLGCALCGRTDDLVEHGYCVTTQRLSWSATVCMPCLARFDKAWGKGNVRIFKVLGEHFPEVWWTPALRLWAEMHPVRERSEA